MTASLLQRLRMIGPNHETPSPSWPLGKTDLIAANGWLSLLYWTFFLEVLVFSLVFLNKCLENCLSVILFSGVSGSAKGPGY